jgi:hypothetical protein
MFLCSNFQACPPTSTIIIIITFGESRSRVAVNRMEGWREQLIGGSRRNRLLGQTKKFERGGQLRPWAIRRWSTDRRLVVSLAGLGHVAVEGIVAAGAQGCHRKERGTLQSCIAVAAVLLGASSQKVGKRLSSCNALIAEVAYHFLFLFKHTNVALGFLWICDPKWSLCVCTANLMLVQLQKKLLAWSIRAKHLVEWLWPCRKRRGLFGWWLGDVVCHVYPSVNCE